MLTTLEELPISNITDKYFYMLHIGVWEIIDDVCGHHHWLDLLLKSSPCSFGCRASRLLLIGKWVVTSVGAQDGRRHCRCSGRDESPWMEREREGEGHRRICMGVCREQNRHIGRSTLRGREENLGENLYMYI
jgi:hypothetical protein